MERRLSEQIGLVTSTQDARLAVESKIETFTRLRTEYAPVVSKFDPHHQDGDQLLQAAYASHPDPVMQWVRDNWAAEGGPTDLVQYRALSSEMHAAAKRLNPFSLTPWPCKTDCVICSSEARCLASDQCSICPHALLDGGMENAVLPEPPAAAGITTSFKPLPALTNTAAAAPAAVPTAAKPALTNTTAAPAAVTTTNAIATAAGTSDVTAAAHGLALAGVPIAAAAPVPIGGVSIVAAPPSAPPTAAPPDVGSDAWRALPEEVRLRQLRSLYESLSMTGSSVRNVVRTYLVKIAPLERIYHHNVTRGHSYRGGRYAGSQYQQQWTTLIMAKYEPILCRVLAYMDANEGMSIWAAADIIEEAREQVGCNWDKFLDTSEIKEFVGNKEKREPYINRLQAPEFAESALAASVAAIVGPEPVPVPAADEMDVGDSPIVVPPIENAVTRILGLDPAISCGFSILQLDAAGQILSADVGVIDVSDKSLTSDGARCNKLHEQCRTLLSPVPDHVYIEPYFGHGRQGDAISFKLRAAIEMLLATLEIKCNEVAPQTWKKTIANNGNADKKTITKAIYQSMGVHFPIKLFIGGRWLKFRDDASDATGIAMHVVKQLHGSISFSTAFVIQAPGKPNPLPGEPLDSALIAPPTVALAPAEASVDSPPPPGRASRRVDYASLACRGRKRPADGAA